MKKKLSIKEFQAYITSHTLSEISFWSENQEWYTVADPLKIKMIFPIILIGENPNVIYLKDGTKKELFFDRVKYIYIDDNSTVLGAVFYIHCNKNGCKINQEDNEIIYTLIAS